jgi:hypothetical protein
MRGQTQTSAARLGTLPARVRWATWAEARVRKRKDDRAHELAIVHALGEQRRRELRAASGRPTAPLRRLPY